MGESYRDRLASTPRVFPFPLAYALPLLVFASAVILPRGAGDIVEMLLLVAALTVIIALHRRPELRRLKYEAILIGTWVLGVDFLTSALGHTPLLLWALAPVASGLLAWPVHRYIFQAGASLAQLAGASLAYRFTHSLFGSLGSVVLFLLIFYLSSIRYVDGLFLTRLCLRPTSDTGAFTAVGAAL
jgi:hypothetical protein